MLNLPSLLSLLLSTINDLADLPPSFIITVEENVKVYTHLTCVYANFLKSADNLFKQRNEYAKRVLENAKHNKK